MAEQPQEQQFVGLTCPECHGPILATEAGSLEFRCITGHAYSPEAMRVEHAKAVESALWSATASLREHASLLRRMAQRMEWDKEQASLLEREAVLKAEHAAHLLNVIDHLAGECRRERIGQPLHIVDL